jgi:hypothetical protein
MAQLNRHHLLASSRGGGDGEENLITLPVNFHMHLHAVFHNLTLEESVEFLREVLKPKEHWTPKRLRNLRNRIKKEEK